VWWFQPTNPTLIGLAAIVTIVGTWAAWLEEERMGAKDPRAIVIDEVAGMLISCVACPRTWVWVLGLFLAFRVFDVVKPLGINKLQDLPGGLGIMADDVLAGIYVSLLGQLRHLV